MVGRVVRTSCWLFVVLVVENNIWSRTESQVQHTNDTCTYCTTCGEKHGSTPYVSTHAHGKLQHQTLTQMVKIITGVVLVIE